MPHQTSATRLVHVSVQHTCKRASGRWSALARQHARCVSQHAWQHALVQVRLQGGNASGIMR